ncbi:MAG: homoserine kinase [Acidobacteria bacterium]|nr:homoserine kinase [Acidobacteriota bacterium]
MMGTASAPASSANLGPGFDCLGLALELRCTITSVPSDRWEIEEGGSVGEPEDGDLVVRAAILAGGPPCRISISNDIPRARGLGSSAAVITASAAAAFRAIGVEPSDRELFAIVQELEGHGDNAGASVYGGLVAAFGGELVRLTLHPSIRVVAAIPDFELKTDAARSTLPSEVSHGAAVRNVGRVAFLVEGLHTGNREVLAMARGDELHESFRASLSPVTGELIEAALSSGALHASWSGAGPTALAFVTDDHASAVVGAMEEALGDLGQVRELQVATTGWR